MPYALPPLWGLRVGVLCLLLGCAACSSKGPQYPEDHARYVRLDQAVEAFRTAYTRKDLSAIQGLMVQGDALGAVESEIKKDFEQFEEISLDFSISRVVINGDDMDVFIHWQGQWKRSPNEAGIRDRGHGMLRWTGMQSILLTATGGDLPFGMAGRHVAPPSAAPIS
jgi:hypothetical protein